MIVLAIVLAVLVALAAIALAALWYYGYFEKEELMISSEFEIAGKKTIRHEFKGFQVWEIHNVLDENECQDFIDKTENAKKEVDDKNMLGTIESYKLTKIIASLMEIPVESKKSFTVYKYIPGEGVSNHYDGCKKNVGDDCAKRAVSNLLYLNGDFEGGEIHFTELGLTIKPETGKLVLFKNYDEKGEGFMDSVHQGLPVTNGMKYVLV